MILLIDNYDSFVHNVARYLRLSGKATRVIRNDEITVDQCWQLQPEAIVLSPGPHRPEEAGVCLDVISRLAGEIPILGICLGHQAIAVAYGGEVVMTHPAHASASPIGHDGTGVFNGLNDRLHVGRYHSLSVREATLPRSLEVTAWTTPDPDRDRLPNQNQVVDSSRVVMGISDHARCVHGVQFHPESLLTESGGSMFDNFFRMVDSHHARARRLLGGSAGLGRPVVWMSSRGNAGSLPSELGGIGSPPPLSIATRRDSSHCATSSSRTRSTAGEPAA